MSELFDLAQQVNFSVGIPGVDDYDTTKKFKENAVAFLSYAQEHVKEILSLDNNSGYHVGMAFNNVVQRMEDPCASMDDIDDMFSDDAIKFKIYLYCAVVCLWKGIQMGTMQSVIAAHNLIGLIDKNKTSHFDLIFAKTLVTTGMLKEGGQEEVEKIYKYTKYYLIQLTRAQDAFKDANMRVCEMGERCIKEIYKDMCERLQGYTSLGVIA